MEKAQTQPMPTAAKVFVAAVGVAGLTATFLALQSWTPELRSRFIVFLLMGLAGAGMKVKFPGVQGNVSVSYVIWMLSLLELEVGEALLVAMASTIAQGCWRRERVRIVQVFFNTTCISLAFLAAAWVYRQHWFPGVGDFELLRLNYAGLMHFTVNSLLVSAVIALTENRGFGTIWKGMWHWSLCYYVAGVSLAEVVHIANQRLGWSFMLALLPLIYLIYRSYRLYFSKLEQEKSYAEGLAALHLRTIEALAMAIEAKDECTHDHLRRVQVYSLELAKHLGLSANETQALQAASILHDIGKLAVPDYIISKPGKLTPEEFDKMKIHTVVGAAILEEVGFPYEVAPIVRSHHEKWDGSGYPDGLKGEDIPIGARILSAVDCLDALASDRQYRRALPLDEAMEYVVSMAGRSFDPAVVDILKNHYREFERLAQGAPARANRLAKDVVVSRGGAPDAGYEKSAGAAVGMNSSNGREPVPSAREIQAIIELTRDLTGLLRPEEGLTVLTGRLRQLVPFDCLAVYVLEGDVLRAKYVNGEDSRIFASLEIPIGQGLSGWVVENRKPIINGNPSVEPGYPNVPGDRTTLHSALAIPLSDGMGHVMGALTLYRAERDAYNSDHLRILLAMGNAFWRAVDNAIHFRQSEDQVLTDELTGLADSHALGRYLRNELENSEARQRPLSVMVCSPDGLDEVVQRNGRFAADQLLKRVARVLESNCRSSDYVARLESGEFVLVLANSHGEELIRKIELLDTKVRQAGREVCGQETIGLSVGLACFPENGANVDSLLSYATQDLQRAQRAKLAARSPLLQLAGSVQQPD